MNEIEVKNIIENKSKQVVFVEDTHTYFYADNKDHLLKSTTELISNYTIGFDPDGTILRNTARRRGITEEELKEEWELKKNKAAERGTETHAILEKYILNNCELKGEIENDKAKQGISFLENLKQKKHFVGFKKILLPEVLVYSRVYDVAGQIDFIIYNEDGSVSLGDWKTNKKPFYYSSDNSKHMLKPLEHIVDNTFNKYVLQLSTYRFFLESWGIKVKDLFLVQLFADHYDIYPITYFKKEVKNMLKDYLKKKEAI